ncbi:hypothetical protein [Roseivirga misakiensis]|uniref:Uncharacterized protein n=1 Tax=Roseivirga misakiensis TaxID=1563681 RepID=A0A1E5T2A2_9BACT|nr:hypothetical protein [Roseivirga misakiensis]OEK05427.1 hypothetical protein BFP71_18745 [Roseivirga misakiensis]
MKKLSLLLVLLIFMACEEGVIITVPASSSYSFTMPSSQINAADDNVFSGSQVVDITQFFNEDAEQIESIKLDKLTYEVSGYSNNSGNLVLMDLSIATRLNGTTTEILVITGLVVENTGEVIAFEDGNPASALSAAQVASLESIMDNLQPFDIIVTGDFTDDIDGDFDVSISWDITASVAQPSTGGG